MASIFASLKDASRNRLDSARSLNFWDKSSDMDFIDDVRLLLRSFMQIRNSSFIVDILVTSGVDFSTILGFVVAIKNVDIFGVSTINKFIKKISVDLRSLKSTLKYATYAVSCFGARLTPMS